MTPPRFQFTIRNLMWATFWVAVSFGGWVLFTHEAFRYMAVLRTTAFCLVLFGPCAAIGCIAGYPRAGIAVGFVLAAILVAFISWVTIVSGFPY